MALQLNKTTIQLFNILSKHYVHTKIKTNAKIALRANQTTMTNVIK